MVCWYVGRRAGRRRKQEKTEMTKSSEARQRRRYEKRDKERFRLPDGRSAEVFHSPDPAAALAFMEWTLTSDDPVAVAGRAWLMKRDLTGYVPPDVVAFRSIEDKDKPLTPADFIKVAH